MKLDLTVPQIKALFSAAVHADAGGDDELEEIGIPNRGTLDRATRELARALKRTEAGRREFEPVRTRHNGMEFETRRVR